MFLVIGVFVVATASKPVFSLGALAALIVLVALFLMPKERVALAAGCSSLALLVLVPVQNIASYGDLKYGILAVVVMLAAVTLLRRPGALRGNRPALWLLLAYFAVLTLATPNSLDPGAWSLFGGAVVAGLGVAVPFAAMSPAERGRCLTFIVGLASALALYSLVELAFRLRPVWGYDKDQAYSAPVMHNQIVDGLVRSEATLGHPLPLALLILVGIALLIRGNGPKNKALKVSAVVLLLAGCFAAGSRSALAVALLLLCLGIGRSRWKAVVVGGYVLVLGSLVAVANGLLESDVYQRFVLGNSLSHRTGALDSVPGLLEDQEVARVVFGNGYFSAYQLYKDGLLQAGNFFAVDNQFVMTLVEGGILGVLILAALITHALLRVGHSARLGLLAVVFFFLSFDVLSWPSGMALFAAFIGLAFSARAKPQQFGAEIGKVQPPALELTMDSGGNEKVKSAPVA